MPVPKDVNRRTLINLITLPNSSSQAMAQLECHPLNSLICLLKQAVWTRMLHMAATKTIYRCGMLPLLRSKEVSHLKVSNANSSDLITGL